MSVIASRSGGHAIAEPLLASNVCDTDTVTKAFEKTLLKSLHAPAGTSLSHQINYRAHSLRKVASFEPDGKINVSDGKSGKTAAIPAFARNGTIKEKKVLVAQPCLEEPANQKRSPLSLRPQLPKKWSFKRLGPGLTSGKSYILSTVLGDASKYPQPTYVPATKSGSLVNQQTKHFLNAAPILQQRGVEKRPLTDPVDATSRCLERFEQTALERRKLAKTLAARLNRRVEDLVLSDVDNFCAKNERRAVSEVLHGARSVYETLGPGLQPIGGVEHVVPELLGRSPYDKLTFTEKPHSLKVLTGSASEGRTDASVRRKEVTCRKLIKEPLPPGIRHPSFDNLLVSGTNNPHTSTKSNRGDDPSSNSGYCTPADSTASLNETGRDPFLLYENLPDDGNSARTDNLLRPSVLEISSANDSDITITRKSDGVHILVKLCARPQGIPAITSLVLTNPGPEALSFGLVPYDYPNPLWPTERTGMIYFIHPSGLLEAGDVHILTAAFECHVNGNFAEAYKMWLLPKGTKPENIVIVVYGTSTSPVESRSESGGDEICDQSENQSMVASLTVKRHMRDLLREANEPPEPGTVLTLEERFASENNLDYQSEAVTKLQYIWIFAHLRPENIPWYQSSIDMERLHRGGLPGEITKVMLEELAAAQEGMRETVTRPPGYLSDKFPSAAEGVYWKNPKETKKCDIHDKDFPLPDSAEVRKDDKDHTAVTTVLPVPEQLPPPKRQLEPFVVSMKSQTATPALFGETDYSNPFPFQRTTHVKDVEDSRPRQSKASESGSDWVPIHLVQDSEGNTMEQSSRKQKPYANKKPPFSLELNSFYPQSTESSPIDPDRLAQDALVDEKWRRFWIDQEWIKTAVTYSLNQTAADSARLIVPQWDYRLQTLRSIIQSTSNHNIFIKLALLREARKVEKSMLHLQPRAKSILGAEERMEEVVLGFVEDILEKATVYANNLYKYFEKCAAGAVPEEPPVPDELQKARERMRMEEAAATGKVGQKTKKVRAPDVPPDEQSTTAKSRSARESGDKSALAVNRPSKSGVNSAKSSVAGKDLKRGGAHASTNMETGRTEKDVKQQIVALEGEYDAAVEIYESKMAEFRRWRQQKEAEIEPKVRSFAMALWEQGINRLLEGIVHPIERTAQLEHNAAIEDFKRDVMAKRDVTLGTLYVRLIEIGGNLAMAAEGWRMQLNDSLMQDGAKREYGDICKNWEQRRKELKIWKMERPNECYTMQPGNIWQSPYSYEKQELLEPLPYRHRTETSVNGRAAVKGTEITVPKFGDSTKKVSPGNVLNIMPEHPSSVLASTISGKNIAAKVEQPSAAAEVIRAIRTGLNSAETDSLDRSAEIQHNSHTDDWTDEEIPEAAMFKQSDAQTEHKLPSDFKFVSFKKSAAVGSVDPKAIGKRQTNPKNHVPRKDEHSSSDEE